MERLRERGKLTFEWIPEGVERILDLGCSTGHDTAWFSRKAGDAWGLDYSEDAIAEARKNYPHIKFVRGSSSSLPFDDGFFDVVTFIEVLEHLPYQDEMPTIREIHRVLKPGGILIMSTPHKGLFYFLDPLDAKFKLFRLAGLFSGNDRYNRSFTGLYGGLKGHKHYTLSEIRGLLEGGFEIVRVYRNSLLLHPLSTWVYLLAKKAGLEGGLLKRTLQAVSDFDFSCRYGRYSFNMHIMARKSGVRDARTDVGD